MNVRRCQSPLAISFRSSTASPRPVLTSYPVSRLSGFVRAPGDKSCSHRALIFGGLAEGTTKITGLLEGDDVLRTGDAMAALGADVRQDASGEWTVTGVGSKGLTSPEGDLDFGNSGTGSRLMLGVMAGYDLEARIIGDTSLSARPMGRVMDPLSKMGAMFDAADGDRLPLTLKGSSKLAAMEYTPPHASAQIKSAVLLAGLNAVGTTILREPRMTRDHTERMLQGFGATLQIRLDGGNRVVSIEGGQTLSGGNDLRVPGDPSSAAFLVAAGVISPGGDVTIEDVMSNETRDGFFRMAQRMGGVLGAESTGDAAGERLINLAASRSELKGITVPESVVPSMIDEFPILAVVAAFAEGETRVTGASELRVKETDRIAAVVDMLRVNGVDVEDDEDGFVVQGCGGPPPGGGTVETRHDHRIAMSALVMGTSAQNPVTVDDASMIATSYPDFVEHLNGLGADIRDDT
ncbi:MAG: 3-phosphoshikimate 1-carboxyvinyltransferase [Pseudomonadota bacterium]